MQTAATTETLVVVKIGGAAGVAREEICADVAALQRAGQLLLLVHGGSDMATQLGAQLGHPAQFVTTASGHSSRYTDARTLEIFLMATALLNRQLCARLNALGCSAVGLSGIDGGLLLADRKTVLQVVANGKRKVLRDDHTGSIKQVPVEQCRGHQEYLKCARICVAAAVPACRGYKLSGMSELCAELRCHVRTAVYEQQ